jgi:glutamate dehydrogenase
VEQVLCVKARGGKIVEEWIRASEANSIYSHFLLGLEVDVFLPCGGRPRTLSGDNWEDFLLEDGTPSAKLIVEGANLYLDHTAREKLEEKGVVIIKDASANKCGVICSSYEIMSGLLLSADNFQKHKEQIVLEVLEILKDRAQKEAKLLLNCVPGTSRIKLTESISNKINSLGDQILRDMPNLRKRGEAEPIFEKVSKTAISKTLLKYGRKKLNELPELYRDALVASFISSSLVYKYGVDYQPSLIDSLKSELQKGLFKVHDPH